MNIISIILSITLGYLLGSVNFAIIISKIFKKEDIRVYGSGNAGMSNMLRTYGIKYGGLTLVGDILKGVLATVLGGLICKYLGSGIITQLAGLYLGGASAIVGHIFPAFFKFKGGKAVATSAGVVGVICPQALVILIIIFILAVALTRYISLGSIICALAYPLLTAFFSYINKRPVAVEIILSSLIAILVIYMHRTNIDRLLKGTESKISFKKNEDQ